MPFPSVIIKHGQEIAAFLTYHQLSLLPLSPDLGLKYYSMPSPATSGRGAEFMSWNKQKYWNGSGNILLLPESKHRTKTLKKMGPG